VSNDGVCSQLDARLLQPRLLPSLCRPLPTDVSQCQYKLLCVSNLPRTPPDDTSSAAGFSHAQVYYSSPRTAQHGFKLTGGPGASNSDRHSQKSQQQQKRKQGTEATSDKRRRLSTAGSSTLDDLLPMPVSKKRPARTFNEANGILPPQARSKSAQPLPVIANKPLAPITKCFEQQAFIYQTQTLFNLLPKV
jgi:hypothetical protein